MKSESQFYQWLVRGFPPMAHVVRIESSTMSGIPDLNVCHDAWEFWAELKIFVDGRVLLRKEQNAWIHRRDAARGPVFILAWHPTGVHVWSPPFKTVPHGKYLAINSAPDFVLDRDALLNFLFT